MVYDDNKGHKYEKKVAEIMKEKQVQLSKEPAGSTGDIDLEFLHDSKKFSMEMKENAVGPDWGQVGLRYENDSWKWSSSKKREDIIKIYDKLELDGIEGVLNFLNKKFIPNKGRVEKITKKEHDEDFSKLDNRFEINSSALEKFYEDIDYLQVGNGYGFYHINSDVAKLGTEKIIAKFKLRLRVKPIHNHHNRCPKCEGRYQGSYKKCKKCGLKLSTNNPQKCQDCGKEVSYSEFIHVYDNYSFFAVLKCTSISKKSKLNMEPFEGQEFPPIIN
jgi:hypothetical protein